jgi:hypothetical protein
VRAVPIPIPNAGLGIGLCRRAARGALRDRGLRRVRQPPPPCPMDVMYSRIAARDQIAPIDITSPIVTVCCPPPSSSSSSSRPRHLYIWPAVDFSCRARKGRGWTGLDRTGPFWTAQQSTAQHSSRQSRKAERAPPALRDRLRCLLHAPRFRSNSTMSSARLPPVSCAGFH